MKLENFSQYEEEDENGASTLQRLQQSFRLGFASDEDKEAQIQVIDSLKKRLDDRFTVYWNLKLDKVPEVIHFVIVGPPGVTVIHVSTAQGVFRANGDEWTALDTRGSDFKPSKPNLIKNAAIFSKAVETLMVENGITGHQVDGVLVMMDPGTHVETINPVSRVVLMDAVEPFASRLNRKQPTLRREDGIRINNLMIEQGYRFDEPEKEDDPILLGGGDEFSEFEMEEPSRFDSMFDQIPGALNLEKLQNTFKFTRKQWIIVGALILGDLALLILAIIVIRTLASAMQ